MNWLLFSPVGWCFFWGLYCRMYRGLSYKHGCLAAWLYCFVYLWLFFFFFCWVLACYVPHIICHIPTIMLVASMLFFLADLLKSGSYSFPKSRIETLLFGCCLLTSYVWFKSVPNKDGIWWDHIFPLRQAEINGEQLREVANAANSKCVWRWRAILMIWKLDFEVSIPKFPWV